MSQIHEPHPAPPGSRGTVYWRSLLTLLCAAGIAAGLYLNRFGVDLEPDSAMMVTAGFRMAHGEGISIPNIIGPPIPMTWFPPLVSWLAALCERTGVNYRTAFGVFNALAWGILAAWTGRLAAREARGGFLAGLFAAGTVVTSVVLCLVNGTLYSEPFFLLWLMGALAFLARWWERPLARDAALAGLCVGGALLTRYVGITLAATGAMVMIARPGPGRPGRLAQTALFGILSGGPSLAWLLWQAHDRGDAPRELAWHPVTAETLNQGVATLASFIIPADYVSSPLATRAIAVVAGLLVMTGLWLWFHRDAGKKPREKYFSIPPLVGINAVFAAVYVAFLLVSISIADADTPLDGRILCVLIPPGAIFMAWLGHAIFQEHGKRARIAAAAVVFALLVLQATSTARFITARKGVLWPADSTSDTLDALRTLPPDAIIYSSDPFGIYIASRRRTELLPDAGYSDDTPKDKKHIQKQTDAMIKGLSAKGGWVVYWQGLCFTDPVMDIDTLKDVVDIKETTEFDDGTLFKVVPRIVKPASSP